MKNIIKLVNDRIAIITTLAMSTMWCVYLFILLSLLPIGAPQWQNQVLYISNCIQLVALPVIMVGQALLGKKAEQRAEQDHQILMQQFEIVKNLVQRDRKEHRLLTKMHDKIDDLIEMQDKDEEV